MQATLRTRRITDLHWLSFLLTRRRDQRINVAAETAAESSTKHEPFFAFWMKAWSRRVAIAKALAGIREELAASKRRTEMNRLQVPTLSPRESLIHQGATRSEVEAALLVVDHFPRAAVVLSVFEGVAVPDCAVLLDASPELVKRALNIGLFELTRNLATAKAWQPEPAHRSARHTEIQYA